jgi:hypothetical protein
MSMKTAKWYRPPTAAEIACFDGMHCASLYASCVATGWRCPSCNRTAPELIRWSEIRGPSWRARYGDEWGRGWTISITRHHCHSETSVRFPETVICGDCNSADGAAKRKLKLPADFSFSPRELAQFVKCTPYSGKTEIDCNTALLLFNLFAYEESAA